MSTRTAKARGPDLPTLQAKSESPDVVREKLDVKGVGVT
jgi:hypothetical protein